jgi:hypothetical protein
MDMRVLSFIFILSLPVFADDNILVEEISAWPLECLGSNEEVTSYFQDGAKEIRLTNKEKAYLIPVLLKLAGRNEAFQTVLTIPSKKKLILLNSTIVKSIDRVLDVDGNNVSEIFVKNFGSAGGSEIGEKAIVQIDKDGKSVVLRKVSFETNEGVWGKGVTGYYKQDVDWDFSDSNLGEDIKDLIETITVEKGRNGKPPVIIKTIKRYHFINNYFLKYKEENNL